MLDFGNTARIIKKKQMIESIVIIGSHIKGALVGGCTGAMHETYIVIKKKSRMATFGDFFIAIIVSAFVGHFAFDGLAQAGMEGAFLVILTVILSLNSFLVIQLLTNLSFLTGMLKLHFPVVKISEEELKKIEKYNKK